MAKEEKKPKSVDEIIKDYHKYHYAAGKGFKDRIKKFDEFHDPENIHNQQFGVHAHYIAFGKPSDFKSFPGAYNEAYKVLDKHLKDDGDKLEDEDKLAEILEKYTDTFLQKAIGNNYKKMVDHAEKEEGLKKKELREFKGQLMSRFYAPDGKNPVNMLDDRYLKQLKGKRKVELIQHLRSIGESTTNVYHAHLTNQAIEGLLTEEDRFDLAKYVTPVFKERGWKHKHSHITRSVEDIAQHYGALLQGDNDSLKKAGYKVVKYEKKDDKKK